MDIIQSFYYSSNKDRQQELELCLKKNLFSEFINNIHIFITQKDYNTFLQSNFITNKNYKKLIFIIHDNQPSYSELFTYSSKLDDKICLLLIFISFNFIAAFSSAAFIVASCSGNIYL